MLYTFQNQFTIQSIGNFLDRIFPGDFDFKGEQHPFAEMVYIVAGNVEVVEDENVYKLQEGDLILHAPMEFHRIKSDADTTPHVLNLSFSSCGNLPPRLYNGVFHITTAQRTALLKLHRLGTQFCMQASDESALDTAPYLGQQIVCALSALLLEICQEMPLSNVLSKERSALLYKQLVDYMEEHICQNLSLEELAEHHYVSVSYVKKLFRIYANIGPRQFYNHMRVREAILRLTKGISAAEIADQMNFSSPNYFSLFFKNQTGITPSEYKKQVLSSILSE